MTLRCQSCSLRNHETGNTTKPTNVRHLQKAACKAGDRRQRPLRAFQLAAEPQGTSPSQRKGLVSLVLYSRPAFTAYQVPRAGLGELPLLFASQGLQVVAFEPIRNRSTAIGDLVSEMKSSPVGLPAGSVGAGGARDVPDSAVDPDSICIATLLSSTYPLDQEDALMTALVSYSALVFEPRSLFRQRETAAEQERCVQQIVAMGGYTTIRPFLGQNVVFCSRPSVVPNASYGGI